jgi:hypothetical protein
MREILELLFDKTEKVVAWAGMVVLVFAILNMSSCQRNSINVQQKTLTMLIEKGYHPLVVNCIMEGWQNRTERLIVCMDAFDKYPGQQDGVLGELGKTD